MARLLLKVVLGLGLLAGVAVLLAAHQLYVFQLVSRGEDPAARHLFIPALVPQLEALLGTEAILDPRTLEVAWIAGGVAAGVGFLGLFVLGLQDSAQARRAARLVPPPTFDNRDPVSSHHFAPDGLKMWTTLCHILCVPCFLFALLLLIGIYPAVTHGQWLVLPILLGAVATFAFMGVALLRRAADPRPKHGVEQIDVMLGGLRWVRHDDPAVRTVAWAQVSSCSSYHNLAQPWKNQTVVTLRTGEQIWLWARCLTDYDGCVDLVERGRKEGRLSAPYAGTAGLAAAFRFNR